jgi:hypothetical protein
VTYCWNNVYVAISVQRNWVHEEERKGCEVVQAEPF